MFSMLTQKCVGSKLPYVHVREVRRFVLVGMIIFGSQCSFPLKEPWWCDICGGLHQRNIFLHLENPICIRNFIIQFVRTVLFSLTVRVRLSSSVALPEVSTFLICSNIFFFYWRFSFLIKGRCTLYRLWSPLRRTVICDFGLYKSNSTWFDSAASTALDLLAVWTRNCSWKQLQLVVCQTRVSSMQNASLFHVFTWQWVRSETIIDIRRVILIWGG